MQIEKLVDVFAFSGQRIGRYTINTAGFASEKTAEYLAIEEAIRNGDARETDRARLIAVVRQLRQVRWPRAA